jgi:AhpD family alkylhydroperoxidase
MEPGCVDKTKQTKTDISMKERMNIEKVQPGIYKAMDAAEKQVASFGLDKKLTELVKLRVSQVNGCGYCVNMHSVDAIKAGETQQRVFAMSAWWETPFFSATEQAAFRLAEEVTLISNGGIAEKTYQEVNKYFSEAEIAQLIFTATVTNSWNRIAISVHMIAE